MTTQTAREATIACLRKLGFDTTHLVAALAEAEDELERAAYEAAARYFERYMMEDRP